MSSVNTCLFAIRTLSLLLFVFSATHLPEAIFRLFQQPHIMSRFDLALLLILIVLSHILIPLILWFSAPFLSRKMLPEGTGSAGLAEPAPASEYLTVGIALIGLFLLVTSFPLFSGQLYSLLSLEHHESMTASQRFVLDNSLRTSLFESTVKTFTGVLLFFKAPAISKLAGH
jgi:hypothetical protein